MTSAASFTGVVPELAKTFTDDSKAGFPRETWRANYGEAGRYRALSDKL